MEIQYKNKDIKRICEDEGYALKKFSPKIVESIKMLMYKLCATDKFDEFKKNPVNRKYHVHDLAGDKQGIISLWLDYSYRMTVEIQIKLSETQDLITILEVTKHYGD